MEAKQAIEMALAHEIVQHVIDFQLMNLTRLNRLKPPERKAIVAKLEAFARVAATTSHRVEVPKPDVASIRDARFANQVFAAIDEATVEALGASTYRDLQDAHGDLIVKRDESQRSLIFLKIAIYASQVSWMVRHDLDPELLRMTPEQQDRRMAELTAAARQAGVPVAGFRDDD